MSSDSESDLQQIKRKKGVIIMTIVINVLL